MVDYIKSNQITNIISFGSGTCVLEYLLGLCIRQHNSNTQVFATDFNQFYIDRAALFLPGITPVKFDIVKDNIADLMRAYSITFDLGFSFFGFYVMDDHEFVKFLRSLKAEKVEHVIDFQAGTLNFAACIRNYPPISYILNLDTIRKIIGKRSVTQPKYKKLHGYARSKRSLRKIYKASGYRVLNEFKIIGNVAILRAE